MMQELIKDLVQTVAADLPYDFRVAYERVELFPDGSGGTLVLYGTRETDAHALAPLPAPPSHLSRWRSLWKAMADGSSAFTTATLRLESTGHFDLDYGYEPIPDEAPMVRQGQWLAGLREREGWGPQ